MKLKTKIKSKLSRTFSENFPGAYGKFTMSHMQKNEGMPEANMLKPLNECKIALISTAGIHLQSDMPFDIDNPAGDHTIRIILSDVEETDLTVTHIYIDTKFAKSDPTIVFPLQQLKELAAAGKIGSVSDVTIGLNGGILKTELVEKESIPQVVELFLNKGIDAALLVPGWGSCHNVLGLYARALEASNIATAMATVFPEVTDKAGVPRTLHVPFKMGRTCGEPFDFKTRSKVAEQLVRLLALPAGSRETFKDTLTDLI